MENNQPVFFRCPGRREPGEAPAPLTNAIEKTN